MDWVVLLREQIAVANAVKPSVFIGGFWCLSLVELCQEKTREPKDILAASCIWRIFELQVPEDVRVVHVPRCMTHLQASCGTAKIVLKLENSRRRRGYKRTKCDSEKNKDVPLHCQSADAPQDFERPPHNSMWVLRCWHPAKTLSQTRSKQNQTGKKA